VVGVLKMTEEKKGDEKGDNSDKKNRKMDDNVIYVGKKGVMNYVMAAITQMNKGEKEIHVKARGRSISKAVDVVQLLKNRFETDTSIKDIIIDTEEVDAEEGGKINVSTIDIVIKK
jgi:DNA-binding protein